MNIFAPYVRRNELNPFFYLFFFYFFKFNLLSTDVFPGSAKNFYVFLSQEHRPIYAGKLIFQLG